MTHVFGTNQGRYYPPCVTVANAVPPDEVDAILALGNSLPKITATIAAPQGDTLAVHYRGSQLSWIHPSSDSQFLFNRLEQVALKANEEHFGFDLTGLTEPVQFTEYEAPSAGYGWHIDLIAAPNQLQRKLSVTVQLTEGDEYRGGNVEFAEHNGIVTGGRARGSMVLFPSFQHHRVEPIVQGTRRSLVAWIGGPNFR